MLNSGWHNFLSVAGALLVGAVGMHMYKEHTDGNVVLDDAAAIVTAISTSSPNVVAMATERGERGFGCSLQGGTKARSNDSYTR